MTPPDFGTLADAVTEPGTLVIKRPIRICDRGYQDIQDTP